MSAIPQDLTTLSHFSTIQVYNSDISLEVGVNHTYTMTCTSSQGLNPILLSGQRGIRTPELRREQIYSLSVLTTHPSTQLCTLFYSTKVHGGLLSGQKQTFISQQSIGGFFISTLNFPIQSITLFLIIQGILVVNYSTRVGAVRFELTYCETNTIDLLKQTCFTDKNRYTPIFDKNSVFVENNISVFQLQTVFQSFLTLKLSSTITTCD